MTKLFILILAFPLIIHAENQFKNGDMNTTAGWRGDKKFVEDSGNRVIVIDANKNRKVGFSQDANIKGKTSVKLSFRYKSTDYKGLGLEVRRSSRQRGSSTNVITLKNDGQWHTHNSEINLGDKPVINIAFSLHEGTGAVMLDDIVLE